MQQQNTALRRFTVVFGITMAAVMALSLLLPAIAPQTQQLPVEQPTVAPAPTFPPPPADLTTITFDQRYLHPSGLYTVAEPTGWFAVQPATTLTTARIAMSNLDAQSIIQVDVESLAPAEGADAATLDEVDARYTAAVLGSSWSQYSSWEETGARRRENDRLIIDFLLTLQRQTYVARQISWTDGEWLYSVRVVAPENAAEMLRYLANNVADSIEPNKIFDSPFDWESHYDTEASHIIRFPPAWNLADSAPGRPSSIAGTDGEGLIVEAREATIADAAEATAFVEAARPNATVGSVEPVTRELGEGFAVSYSYRTLDGDPYSGLTVLLNGPEGRLHIADLTFPGAGIDLNAPAEDNARVAELAAVAGSFFVLPNLNVPPSGSVPLPRPTGQ